MNDDFVKAVKSEWLVGYWNSYITRKELYVFGVILLVGFTLGQLLTELVRQQ